MFDDAQNGEYNQYSFHTFKQILRIIAKPGVKTSCLGSKVLYFSLWKLSNMAFMSDWEFDVGETSPALFRRYRLGLETAPDTKVKNQAQETEEQADTVAETPTKSTRWRWCHLLGQCPHIYHGNIAAGSTTSIQAGTTLSTDLQRDLREPTVEDIGWTTTFPRGGIKFRFLGQCNSSVPCLEGND